MNDNVKKENTNNENQQIEGYEIYLQNINFQATANEVVALFRDCGQVIRWHFPRVDPSKPNFGRHRGFGYVFFSTYEAQ